jgi:hypothetical protein
MLEVVPTQAELPPGSHSLSFYATRPEAARNMASFLRGARDRDQSAIVLTADDEMLSLYRDAVEKEVPQMLGSLHKIPGPHVRPTSEGLRPVVEALEFATAHPEGASMCGDTIPSLLNRRTLPNVLVYEDWYDGLRPFYHRGLCPYDLNNLPVDRAPDALSHLAKAHTHAVLSSDPNPAAQFLQLLVIPAVENPPEAHLGWLARAVDRGLIDDDRDEGEAAGLTPRGEVFARALRGLPHLAKRAPRTARDRETHVRPGQEDPRSPRFSSVD